MRRLGSTVRWVVIIVAAFCAGRSCAIPEAPDLAGPFDPVAIGLEGRRADLDVKDASIEQVVASLAETYGADVQGDWAALKAAGVEPGSLASLQATQASLHDALGRLAMTRSSTQALSYTVRGKTIIVTSDAEAARDSTVRLYDLRPVYHCLYGFPLPPDTTFTNPSRYPRPGERGPSREQFVEHVTTVLSHTALRLGSTPPGASARTLIERHGVLIVTARPYVHVQVARELNRLATGQGQQ